MRDVKGEDSLRKRATRRVQLALWTQERAKGCWTARACFLHIYESAGGTISCPGQAEGAPKRASFEVRLWDASRGCRGAERSQHGLAIIPSSYPSAQRSTKLTDLSLAPSQRITYAKSVSHATIAQTEGPEAVYAIKLGLQTAAEKKAAGRSKLTVSGAQKAAADEAKGKRAREERATNGGAEEEEESDEEEEEGPAAKKGKVAEEKDEGEFYSLLEFCA